MKRIGKWISLVVFSILVVVMASSATAQEVVFFEPFDDPDLPGWERTPGVSVSDSVLFVEPGNFVMHSGNWEEFRIVLKMRWSGEGEFILGSRTSGEGSYFLLVGRDYMVIQREGEGRLTELTAVGGITVPFQDWFQLEILLEGRYQQVFINETLVLEAEDSEPLTAGGILFETLGEVTLEIDDLAVYALEAGSPPPPVESSPAEEESPLPETAELPPAEINFEGDLKWIRTGGPVGGLGYDVRMHPENPDIMYVTDALAGVFKSSDGGKHWFPSSEGITVRTGPSADDIPVFCLTIDPIDPETIWVGTQNKRGIFKSEDGGASWEMKVNGIVENEGITFRGFAVDPQNSQIVYAAAEISSWLWAGKESMGREFDKVKGVVYKTTNGGDSWQAIWRGENLARYVLIDPRDTNVIYVSTGIFDREAANSDVASNNPGGEGVLKSTDGGQTWTQINNGLTNLYIGTLVMHPQNPDILMAGAANNAYRDGGGVFLTTNGGLDWEQVLDQEAHSVEFSTSDPMIAYAGNVGLIYRSTDGGFSWENRTSEEGGWGAPGQEAGFPIDFQVDPRNPDRIFANNYGGGNFLSEDGGRTWKDASAGYTGALVRVLVTSSTEAGVVYAGARSGIFVSTNGGVNWDGLIYPEAQGQDWNAVAIDPQDPKHILGANNWTQFIGESRDGGLSWAGTYFPEFIMQGVRVIKFAPSDPQLAYAGISAFYSAGTFDNELPASGVYITHDGGSTWSAANDSLTATTNVSDLAVHPTDPKVVYMTSPASGLFKTEDGGASWTKVGSLPRNVRPLSVGINPANPDLMLMGTERGGVYRSVDGGQTWARISAGIPAESTISTVNFHPTDLNIAFCADTFSGVYRSIDQGQTWQVLNNGLDNRAVNTLAISADGWHVFAGTEGGGVFRLDLNGQPPQASEVPAGDTVPVESPPQDETGDQPESPPPVKETEPERLPEEDQYQPPIVPMSTILLVGGGLLLLVAVVVVILARRAD